MSEEHSFDRLVAEAEAAPFSGWDFSWLRGRVQWGEPPWDFAALIRAQRADGPVLDLGTGGGEFLSSLAPFPAGSAATEAYPPNVPIARARLEPLGIRVMQVEGLPDNLDLTPGDCLYYLPYPDSAFPLVLSKHESYDPAEVRRVLTPGGTFLTQQVGAPHLPELNEALDAPVDHSRRFNLAFAARQVEETGLRVVEQGEAHPEMHFADIGAVVYYLRAVPWQIPDFTSDRYRNALQRLHQRIEAEGPLRVRDHLFWLAARHIVVS